MSKNWTGNKNSIFTTLAATSHGSEGREINDYYATEPLATELLLEVETFTDTIWECAVGEGHMADILKSGGHDVVGSDLINRGYPDTHVIDFLEYEGTFNGDIVTNPPYKYAQQFLEKSMEVIPDRNKVAMFLKLTFLESKRRKEMFKKYPPKTIYVSSSRLNCAKNGDFEKYKSSAVAYAWYVWEKGYEGDPIIKWIN